MTYWEAATPVLVYCQFHNDLELRALNNHLESVLPEKASYCLLVEMSDKEHAEETVYSKNVVALKPGMVSLFKGITDPYLTIILKQKWSTVLALNTPTSLAEKCFKSTTYIKKVLFNVDELSYPYNSLGKEDHLVLKTTKSKPIDIVNFAKQMLEKITVHE